MAGVWFTADTHFSHRSMVEKGWRPQFNTVADMNDALITGWNATVKPGDVVWHLGDWAMGPARDHLPILASLNGTVHLIAGNHDVVWPMHRDAHKHQAAWMAAGFASIQAFARRRIDDAEVMLSHFPYVGDHQVPDRYAGYRLRDVGLSLLHGHVHTEWASQGRQLNVGVDVRGFRPVHIEDVRAELAKLAIPP